MNSQGHDVLIGVIMFLETTAQRGFVFLQSKCSQQVCLLNQNVVKMFNGSYMDWQ